MTERTKPNMPTMFLTLPASADFLVEATLGTALALEAKTSGKVAGGAAGKIAADSTLALLAGILLLFAFRELTFAVSAAFSFWASSSYYFIELTVEFKSLIFSILSPSAF